MILFDAHQAVIACTAKASSDFGVSNVTLSDVRHYFLRLIVESMKKHTAEYGKDVVLAFDSLKGYWRKDEFPFYKFKRKDAKANMPFDMEFAKDCADALFHEMDERTHLRAVRVDNAEGDDVIASIVMAYGIERGEIVDAGNMPNFLIVSSDEDFLQLQRFQAVDQWASIRKTYVRTDDAKRALFDKIVRGDDGDSVPNVTSEDDIYVTKARRQTPITQKKLDAWYEEYMRTGQPPEAITTYWDRNRKMIDFSQIPALIQGQIVEAYTSAKRTSKMDFLGYMTEKKVKGFDEDLQFF